MNGVISGTVWRIGSFIWFCTEIGQFIEQRLSWGNEALYWPMWVCFTLTVFFAAHWLDGWVERHKGMIIGMPPPTLTSPPNIGEIS